jgi:hypothetical protein
VIVLCIDPDPNGGTWVELRDNGEVLYHERNATVESLARLMLAREFNVIEDVQAMGMPVGRSIFETVKNIGYLKAYAAVYKTNFDDTLTRPAIKTALCGSARAKDGNVRQAIIDLYPATGGGKTPQIGTKAQPGPLYGIAADEWAARALGLVFLSKQGLGPLAKRDRP